MRQNVEESAQRIMSGGGDSLLKRPGSEIKLLVILLLIVCTAVLVVHWPVLWAQALSIDDEDYLTENLLVQNPGWESAYRFLAEVLEPSTVGGYYQPLTMISLMVDYAIGGRVDNLMPFHRTSLVLHMTNTALVVVLLYLLFGSAWVAAGVGLLFGLHPMTVEPIPWVGERKTLLAAFFALCCLILYVRYTRNKNWRLYFFGLLMYVLALMSKPTSVALPALMLLMDCWPLKRLSWRTVLEKTPFFGVGVIFAVITYVSQSRTAAVVMPGGYNLGRIVLILCHNIIFYLYKIVWPVNLSSHYPYPQPLGLSDPMILAGVIGTYILIVLLLISLRWTPVLLVGWLFFFVAILPTMQIIGFSNVIASDKFAYLPSIGLLMVLASFLSWYCYAGSKDKAVRRCAIVAIMVLMLASAEAVATRRYLTYWRDTVSLFKHMITLAPDAAPLHNNLGIALKSQGKLEEAVSHYKRALEIEPDSFRTHDNLGIVLFMQGKLDEGISHFRQSLQLRPTSASTHYNLGRALQFQGKLEEAIEHYRQALQLKPDFADVHINLGIALKYQGKLEEAIEHYRQALQISPNFALAHNNLGYALAEQGKLEEAIRHYHQALRIEANYAKAHNNLGNALCRIGQLEEGIQHYRQALQIEPDFFTVHYNLGRALVSTNKYDEALKHFREAMRLRPDWPAPLEAIARILVTRSEPEERDVSQAIELGERAAALSRYQDAKVLDTLAEAYAAAGRFDRAVETAQAALALATARRVDKLADHIRNRLEFYKRAKP